MKKPFVPLLIMTFLMAFFSIAGAQQYDSEIDTLRVVSTGGFQGETVSVLIDMVNTFHVGGIHIRVTYDSSTFEAISVDTTSRSSSLEWNLFNVDEPGVIRFLAASWDLPDNAIPPGAGPIADITLLVKESAAPGLYDIRFENEDTSSYDNALSDSLGLNLVIPVLVDGQFEVFLQTGIEDNQPVPKSFGLAQNYPNPFNRKTMISFTIADPGHVDLEIFDLLGRRVATPYSGWADVGEVSVVWDGRSERGEEVASGIYYFRLRTLAGKSITRRMTLLK